MAEQEVVTFEGLLKEVYSTDKVVKFSIQERFFIAFKKHVTLLKDYMTKDREGTKAKLVLPIPATKSKDKQNNDREQFVLTDHTKIFLDDQLIFFPVEQQQELDDIDQEIARAEEMENELIVMEKQKNALANQKATPKQLSKTSIVKEGGFYEVAGKKIPDAAKIQEEINNQIETNGRTFHLFIIECDKNDEKAWAKVRVEDAITHQIIEDSVVHHYNTLADAFLLDLLTSYDKAIKNGKQVTNPISSFDDQNKPILSMEARKSILIRILKFKQFAERDASTKAASRAYLKMLNREWRTKEEIEDELREVALVNS